MKGAAYKRGQDAIYMGNKDIKTSAVRTVSAIRGELEEALRRLGELVVFVCFVYVCAHVFIWVLAACCVHPVYTYDIDIDTWWFRW